MFELCHYKKVKLLRKYKLRGDYTKNKKPQQSSDCRGFS